MHLARPRGRRAALLLLALAGVTTPAAAQAATIEQAPDGSLRAALDATDDTVFLSFTERPGQVRFTGLEPATVPPSCQVAPGFGTYCSMAGVPGVAVALGAGTDQATVEGGAGVPLTIDGGDGTDRLDGGTGADALVGGPGDDVLDGGAGDDAVDGGDGNDRVAGGAGADRLAGAAGDDELDPDPLDQVAADVVDGGPGADRMSTWEVGAQPRGPISVTLDAGDADDGFPGERDDVRSIESLSVRSPGTVIGTEGPDRITAYHAENGDNRFAGRGGDDALEATEGNDHLDGGGGADRLVGGFGDDTIVGGPGADQIVADADGAYCTQFSCTLPRGNDTIDARDGEADRVDCGVGTDTVEADAADVVAESCETVRRAQPGTPPGASKPKLRAKRVSLRRALRNGLPVTLSGLAPRAKVTVRAALRGRTVARRSARADANGGCRVTLRFRGAARRRLAARRVVRLRVTAGGARATVTLRP